MTEMQVYHEIVEGISYVALVVGRKRHDGIIEPWETDEITVRKLLDGVMPKARYSDKSFDIKINLRPYAERIRIDGNQYHVYNATGKLGETLDSLEELAIQISEGLPEVVRKTLPLEFK